MTNKKRFERAYEKVEEMGGVYKGYAGANALSLYVYDHYNVNTAAHDALCEVIEEHN